MLLSAQEARYPLLVHADLPIYHPVARMAHVAGTVRVEVTVKNGEVVDAEGISGPPMLLQATIENIHTWHFGPDSNTRFVTTFIYRLEGRETSTMENGNLNSDLPAMAVITASPTKPPCNDCGPGR